MVRERRPGRRDPGGAQAGADTSRQPVRGKSQSKSHSKSKHRQAGGTARQETTRGHTEENNTGGEKQRVSKKKRRRSTETETQEPAAYLVELKQD